jgi:hypothetical protein
MPLLGATGTAQDEIIDEERWLRLALAPGQRVLIEATAAGVAVHMPDQREEQTSNTSVAGRVEG